MGKIPELSASFSRGYTLKADKIFVPASIAKFYLGTWLGFGFSLALLFVPFYLLSIVFGYVLPDPWAFRLAALLFLGSCVFAFLKRRVPTVAKVRETPVNTGIETVNIIGAGMAGMVTAKELMEEGFKVRLFEKERILGGIWNLDEGRAYADIISTSSSYITAFSDKLPREVNTELSKPYHLTATEYIQYLHEYAKENHVLENVTHRADVTELRRVQDENGKWVWETVYNLGDENGNVQEGLVSRSDAICYACGTNQKPHIVYPPKHEIFKGKISHSESYKGANTYYDRNVLIIGIGDSAGDMVYHIAETANHVHFSVGRGAIVAPRMVDGIPIDYNNYSLLYALPLRVRNFIRDTIVRKKTYHSNDPIGQKVKEYDGLCPPNYNEGTRFLMKTARFIDAVLAGKATVHHGGIRECTPNGVIFKNGTEVEVDEIIICTGYERFAAPFAKHFPEQVTKVDNLRYLNMIDLDTPNCAHMAMIRPSGAGAVPPLTEAQARLLAQYWRGKLDLGSDEQIRQFIKEYADRYDREHTYTINKQVVQWGQFLDEVYRAIKASPPLIKLYFTNPELYMRLMFVPFTAHRFRLTGPHAKPEIFDKMSRSLTLIPPLEDGISYVRKGFLFSFFWWTGTYLSTVAKLEAARPAMYSTEYVR